MAKTHKRMADHIREENAAALALARILNNTPLTRLQAALNSLGFTMRFDMQPIEHKREEPSR